MKPRFPFSRFKGDSTGFAGAGKSSVKCMPSVTFVYASRDEW